MNGRDVNNNITVTIQFCRIRIILDKFTGYEYHAYKRKICLAKLHRDAFLTSQKGRLNIRIKHLDQMEGVL